MKGTSGSFHTNLFKTIMSADFGNQYRLAFGFPDEVTVVQKYQKEAQEIFIVERELFTKCASQN